MAAGETVGDWAARAALLPAVLVRTTPDAVLSSAHVLVAAATVKLTAASGGDLRLSRVRSGKGARVGVRVKVAGTGSKARALVLPTGPVSLVEGPTRAHRQPFGYSGTSGAGGRRRYATAGQQLAGGGTARRKRAKRAGLIYVPGLGMFQGVKHPGTKGSRPVGRAFAEHHEEAGRVGVQTFADAIRRHLE